MKQIIDILAVLKHQAERGDLRSLEIVALSLMDEIKKQKKRCKTTKQ